MLMLAVLNPVLMVASMLPGLSVGMAMGRGHPRPSIDINGNSVATGLHVEFSDVRPNCLCLARTDYLHVPNCLTSLLHCLEE